MSDTADVVVVGAGIVGVSAAFQLLEAGVRDVLLLDASDAGAGTTSKGTGGIRQQFGSEINVRLSIESVRFFEQFEERVGTPLSFRQVGYLFVTDRPARAAALRTNVELQTRLGAPSALLDARQVADLVPGLVVDGLAAAAFCATDGLASPADAHQGLLSAARRRGARLFERRAATGIRMAGGRVAAVQTSDGSIACGAVVNAAGVRSPEVARMVGLELPVEPHHRQVFVTDLFDTVSDGIPFTVDLDSGAYFHKDSGALILGGTDHGDRRGFDEVLDWSLLPRLVEAVACRLPAALDGSVRRGWAGLREMTPDEHGIVGLAGPDGFVCATGFSGHGFMHAPAVGRLVAELLTTGQVAGLDASALAPQRFTAPSPVTRMMSESQVF